ncbi:MAG: hypothetical protein HC935_03450 [Pseudanabaena sp. SU_2_4]|nr:hypothetical protein [Pseudanabaena sp. SU_2_4]
MQPNNSKEFDLWFRKRGQVQQQGLPLAAQAGAVVLELPLAVLAEAVAQSAWRATGAG